MKNSHKRLIREKKTIGKMVKMYCSSMHNSKENLCGECQELLNYAFLKIDKCVFGIEKPACSECKVHCYAKTDREKVRNIMRFAGPKMIFKHPYLGIMHFVDKYRFKAQNKKTIKHN